MVDRPLIQHVVDEAREAGIEHFIFVTGRNKAVIEDHFDRQFELEMTLKDRNRQADLDLLSRDLPGPGTTSFIRQQLPMGLGHAVWCAREVVGNEPFALLLPDVLVQHKPGCLAQMIEAYRAAEEQSNIIAVEEVPLDRIDAVRRGRRRQSQGQELRDHRHGREAAAREGAVQSHHHRPLHPAAGDFRTAGEAGGRRRRRDPDHRRDDQARQDAAVLWPEVRRPELRLRLQDRLPRRQRRLCAGRAPTSRRRSAPRSRSCSARSSRIYSAVLVTAPLLSTYQRSLAIGLPAKRAAIQSATMVGGCGPRLTDGQAPMAWRAS